MKMGEIVITDLTVKFGEKTVFEDFGVKIPADGLTVIAGESGCGKTTLLRVIAGLLKPQSGAVSGVDPHNTAFLFQENRLFPWRTCLQHITDVLPKEKRDTAQDFLHLCELEGEEGTYPGALSGGMARRLSLARALALGGELYILDEPFAGVDPARRERILQNIRGLNTPILLVSHEQEVVSAADRVVWL